MLKDGCGEGTIKHPLLLMYLYILPAHMGEIRNAYQSLVRKPERKRPFGRHKHSWEDNIKTDIKEIVWEAVMFSLG
jgi:hypothetical protein